MKRQLLSFLAEKEATSTQLPRISSCRSSSVMWGAAAAFTPIGSCQG